MVLKLSAFLIFVVLLGCALHTQALTQISNCVELQAMKDNLSEDYELVNDIDCSDTVNWNGGEGFEPVGRYTGGAGNTPFTGTFDGQAGKVVGLTIARPSTFSVGLFGYTSSSAQISYVGLVEVSILGYQYVGLVGFHEGNLTNSYITGSVTGDNNIGGLVGLNYRSGSVSNSYSMATVAADNTAGGLMGQYNNGLLTYTYAAGSVIGTGGNIGGLVGTSAVGGTGNYWDTEASGRFISGSGVGKTTAQMYQQSTYVGWDFIDAWCIAEGQSYPELRAFSDCLPPSTESFSVTATPVPGNKQGAGSALTPGETAAVAITCISGILSIFYLLYKWYYRHLDNKAKKDGQSQAAGIGKEMTITV